MLQIAGHALRKCVGAGGGTDKVMGDPHSGDVSRSAPHWQNQKPAISLIKSKTYMEVGGESGIRTHGRFDPSPVFKTGALNRSAISPYRQRCPRPACPGHCNPGIRLGQRPVRHGSPARAGGRILAFQVGFAHPAGAGLSPHPPPTHPTRWPGSSPWPARTRHRNPGARPPVVAAGVRPGNR